MRELNEKCGVFGIYGKGLDVARLTFYGLFALQHRGQEATGIAVSDGTRITAKKGRGLVSQVYTEEDIDSLKGSIAIGHNRYSTSRLNADFDECTQPYVCKKNYFALAHNGNLPETGVLCDFLNKKGIETSNSNDSKLMHRAIEYYLDEGNTIVEAVQKAYPLFTGAFSLLIMTHDTLIGVRDAYGMRPLSVGTMNGGFVFASETCALSTLDIETHWEVGPGEMVICKDAGITSLKVAKPNQKFDIFEFVYFARPDSRILGKSVYQARWSSGWELAKEFPVAADVVVPVPDTSVPSAIGYAKYSQIPLEMALIKNRYIHRTFIEPNKAIRERGVTLKLNILSSVVRGKRVVVIDDSIVRSTTSKQITELFFKAGAAEVHFLVASPPVKFPDFYGVDTPTQKDLIGANKSVEEIRGIIGATSLHYLSLEGLIKAIGISKELLSTSCFTGEYCIDIGEHAKKINFGA